MLAARFVDRLGGMDEIQEQGFRLCGVLPVQ
jgi:hypothetical protein